MNCFCTYFDHRYLSKGMALYRSLKEHCPDFKLWVLCLSRECYEILSRIDLNNVYPIRLEDIEEGDKELLKAKRNRSLVEYYFTLTPSLPLYIFNHFSEVDLITYLDSDLYFFSDPAPVFREIGRNSVAIIGHRFSYCVQHFEKYGKYNVGWLSFRRDENGLACLNWYRERCNEWCYDIVEEGRFADQKYLELFSEKVQGVIEVQHKGANLAPWNINNYTIKLEGQHIKVDDDPLIFYHFQGLKPIFGPLYDSGLFRYKARLSKIVRDMIYRPYLHTFLSIQRKFAYKIHFQKVNGIRNNRKSRFQRLQNMFPQGVYLLLRTLRRITKVTKIICTRTYILYWSK